MKTLTILTSFLFILNIVSAQWQPTMTGPFPWCNPIKLITDGNKFILASQACNVIMSTDSCATWTPIHNGIPLSKSPKDIILKDSILFLSVYDTTYSIYSSIDHGNSWTLMNNGLPTSICTNVFSICGNNIFAGTSNGVYFSSNNGNLWTQVNNGLPLNTKIYSIVYDGNNIYVGTYRNGIYFSNNNGNSWNNLNNGLPPNLCIYAINKNGNNILISTRDSASSAYNLYLSVNSGNSWGLANNGMPTNTAVKSFISYGTNIFAGVAEETSGTNVYLTTNNCGLWTDVGDGFEVGGYYEPIISNFVILGDYIYACVDSVFPYKRLLSEMVSVKKNYVNNIFSIFPNPSTGKLTISQNSNLKNIEIFNVLGNVIYYSTFNKYQTSKEIDLSNLPKGIYFVKADNGELTHVEKIIIN